MKQKGKQSGVEERRTTVDNYRRVHTSVNYYFLLLDLLFSESACAFFLILNDKNSAMYRNTVSI